jgi:aarF domain-containing kinase
MVDLKSESQATDEGKELFIEGIEQICIMDENQNFIESVGDYITDICSLACIYHVKLEGAFVNAALAVEIMEGLASALYPDLKVQQVALPMIVKAEMMVSGTSVFGMVDG